MCVMFVASYLNLLDLTAIYWSKIAIFRTPYYITPSVVMVFALFIHNRARQLVKIDFAKVLC